MPYCIRLLHADILPQKLSRRSRDLHVVAAVGRGLHQHRHVQRGVADRIGDAALVAEIRQRHDDAVDLVAMLAEQLRRSGAHRRGVSHRAELRLLRRQRDRP